MFSTLYFHTAEGLQNYFKSDNVCVKSHGCLRSLRSAVDGWERETQGPRERGAVTGVRWRGWEREGDTGAKRERGAVTGVRWRGWEWERREREAIIICHCFTCEENQAKPPAAARPAPHPPPEASHECSLMFHL